MAVPEAALSEPAIAEQDDSGLQDSNLHVPSQSQSGGHEDDGQHEPAHAEAGDSEYGDHAAVFGQDQEWQPPVDEDEVGFPEQAGPETAGYSDDEDDQGYAADEIEAAVEPGKDETRRNWWERKPNPVSDEQFDDQDLEDKGRDPYDDAPASRLRETIAPASSPSPVQTDWSSRFMGPAWRGEASAEETVDQETENAEIAIRETFKAALEHPPEEEEPEQSAAISDEHDSYRDEYQTAWARSDQAKAEQTRSAPAAQQPIPFPAGTPGGAGLHQSMPVPEFLQEKPESDSYYSSEDDEEPAVHSGFEPQRTVHAGQGGAFEDDSDDYDEAEVGDDPAGADVFAGRNGLKQAFGEQQEQVSGVYDEDTDTKAALLPDSGLESFDNEPYDDDPFGDPSGQDLTKETLGDDFPTLRHDLGSDEADDYYPAEESEGGGGLALAASWAVFLAALGGIVVAMLSFRQDIVTALPGTIELYRTLGYEVSVKQVDFAGVDYRWSEVDGQPTIELKGEVVNITNKTVKVPRVLVNVQNSAGVPVTATADVPADELGPHESATFTLELVSPPEDVTQIELEFAQTD